MKKLIVLFFALLTFSVAQAQPYEIEWKKTGRGRTYMVVQVSEFNDYRLVRASGRVQNDYTIVRIEGYGMRSTLIFHTDNGQVSMRAQILPSKFVSKTQARHKARAWYNNEVNERF